MTGHSPSLAAATPLVTAMLCARAGLAPQLGLLSWLAACPWAEFLEILFKIWEGFQKANFA